MNNLTINEVLSFFNSLDLQKKIEILNELTKALKRGIQKEPENNSKKQENEIIEELFGIWKDEDQLTDHSIIERTISDRKLDLN